MVIHEKYFSYRKFEDLKYIVFGNTNSLSERIVSYSLYFKTMLHLCQLYYLFVEKPKHATDVRNDGVTYLLHPLNNPLTTLKPQYSMKCETWQVITAMDGLFNFTMSQQTDRQDLSTHKIMICLRNNWQLTAHLLDYLAII